jgi:hypothetical protein
VANGNITAILGKYRWRIRIWYAIGEYVPTAFAVSAANVGPTVLSGAKILRRNKMRHVTTTPYTDVVLVDRDAAGLLIWWYVIAILVTGASSVLSHH